MIKSMTGFAGIEKQEGKWIITIEIRSYNNRYLDIIMRIPQTYLWLEDRIRSIVAERITRGRIEIRLQITNESEAECTFEINEPKADAYYKALAQLKSRFNIQTDISLDLLARAGGIITVPEKAENIEDRWFMIRDGILEAIESLESMRKKEGDFIASDIVVRLNGIEESTNRIGGFVDDMVFHYQQRLKDRIAVLTRGIVEIDPSRIAQEAAFLADRSDISEEIVRVQSHIAQFKTLMYADEPSGRKLNFLLQELNREFNTMGTKAGNANVSHLIVTVKSELEKIREQIQNVE